MAAAWHPTGWWDWCMSEDKKIEIDQILLIKLRNDKNSFIARAQFMIWEYREILGYMKTWFSLKSLVLKFLDSSCRHYTIWKNLNMLAKKIIHEDLI